MITIPKSVKDKIKNLVDKAVTNSVTTYDSSKSSVTICGMKIDGVMEVNITGGVVGDVVIGINDNADFFTEKFSETTLTIKLLPTSTAIDTLNQLYKTQIRTKGFCYINIVENGKPTANFAGYQIKQPDINFTKKAESRDFVFTVKDLGKLVSNTVLIEDKDNSSSVDDTDQIETLIGVIDEEENVTATSTDAMETLINVLDEESGLVKG